MKKLLAMLLAVAFLLSAVGCNTEGNENDTNTPSLSTQEKPTSDRSELDDSKGEEPPVETESRHETSDLDYYEESVTIELGGVYDWCTYYRVDPINDATLSGNEQEVLVILGQTWVAGDQYRLKVTMQGDKIGTTKLEVHFEGQVRVLYVTVVERAADTSSPSVDNPVETDSSETDANTSDPSETTTPASDEVETYIEDVVHLGSYEVFEWITPFVNLHDYTLTQTDESVLEVLGTSVFVDTDGVRKLVVTVQAWDVIGYTMITVKCGDYTRVLHAHTEGSQAEPPQDGGSIRIEVNDSKDVLTLGERESRLLIMIALPSDGTLTVTDSNENVLSYRYDYHPMVDAYGLVASLELYVTPTAVGESAITISYPEHPDESLTIPFKVVEEDRVYLGEGTLCESISVDKTHAEVYLDDTRVTYTVVTSTDVDKLEFIQLSNDYYLSVNTFGELTALDDEWVFALDTLTVDSSSLSTETVSIPETRTSYSATRKEENGKYIWTVSWDLGSTAVYFVQVNAIDSDAGVTDENYVKLSITYPEFDVSEGLRVVINRWVELNLTEPLIFTVNTDTLTDYQKYVFYECNKPDLLFMDEVEMLMGNPTRRSELQDVELSRLKDITDEEFYDIIFDNNVIYRRTFASQLMRHAMVACMLGNSRHGHSYIQLEGKQILAFDNETPVYFFHYNVYDETRALIAYENGYEIDGEKFPYARDMLEKGKAVIEEIIKEGMTDFEKEKAIYDWMIQNFYKGVKVPPEIGDPYDPNPEWFACVKSAYGILNQYEADCMGWSGAFYLLCNMAGVPCSTFSCNNIPGGADEAFEDANHRNNVVRLDGEYYFVEVYWFYQKSEETQGDYRYLNMTAEMAAQHYSWPGSDAFAPIFADSTTYLVDEHTGELLH